MDLRNILDEHKTLPYTQRQLAMRWGWDRQPVRTLLKQVLENLAQVEAQDKPNEKPSFQEEIQPVEAPANPAKNPKLTQKKEKRKTEPAVIVEDAFPPALDTPECRKAWDEWLAYKADRHENYLPRSRTMLLNKLARYGAEVMCRAIEDSIGNNWQGLFPDRVPPRNNGTLKGVFLSSEERRKAREMDLFERVSAGKGTIKLLE